MNFKSIFSSNIKPTYINYIISYIIIKTAMFLEIKKSIINNLKIS